MKPCSAASERNKDPILGVLRDMLRANDVVLEIGSGTGQHAVHFARHLPDIHWLATDRLENHAGIVAWVKEADLDNLTGPLELDVNMDPWPDVEVSAVYSANTAHIMSWDEVQKMFRGVGCLLNEGDPFCLYGPFNYSGEFTAESNRTFDTSLRSQVSHMGIRDLDDLSVLAVQNDLVLDHDLEMPANNRLLVWRHT